MTWEFWNTLELLAVIVGFTYYSIQFLVEWYRNKQTKDS